MTVTIMKKQNLKARVGMFKNIGGNFPGGNFPGGVWWVEIFRVGIFGVGVFLIPSWNRNWKYEFLGQPMELYF